MSRIFLTEELKKEFLDLYHKERNCSFTRTGDKAFLDRFFEFLEQNEQVISNKTFVENAEFHDSELNKIESIIENKTLIPISRKVFNKINIMQTQINQWKPKINSEVYIYFAKCVLFGTVVYFCEEDKKMGINLLNGYAPVEVEEKNIFHSKAEAEKRKEVAEFGLKQNFQKIEKLPK